MSESLGEGDPEVAGRVEILLDLLETLLCMVIDINKLRLASITLNHFGLLKCIGYKFFVVGEVVAVFLKL